MNIVVLAGGLSPEREVSLSSGRLVSAALRRRGHRVLMLDVWRGLSDREVGEDPTVLFRGAEDAEEDGGRTEIGYAEISAVIPDVAALRRLGGRDALVGDNVLRLCGLADAVFLALHGAAGENGQVQAMLDNFNIRYTGSSFAGSFLAMDKPLSKLILRQGGVLTPDWHVPDAALTAGEACDESAHKVGFPCVIKPCDGGSSIGVTMADAREELAEAITEARRVGGSVMAERRIVGRELTVAILGGEVLPAVEIRPKSGFYDYRNKYRAGCTEEICPAPLTEEQSAMLAASARRAFGLLRLDAYARGDYIMDAEGRFWCLEFNTLPGMTPTSLLPQEAMAAGMPYEDLCDKIVRLAFEVR